MANKKALFLAYIFPPFGSVGSSIRAVKFVKYLPMFGWTPTVVTIADNPEYQLVERSSSFLLDEIPTTTRTVRTKTWQPSPRLARTHKDAATPHKGFRRALQLAKNTILHIIRDHILVTDEYLMWLPFAVRAGWRLNKEAPFDVIFATIPPYSVALSAWMLKLVLHKPLILDVRDDWVDSGRYFAKGPHLRWLERWLERRVAQAADRVILVTEPSQAAFRRRYPQFNPGKFVFIPNGCDLSDFAISEARVFSRSQRFTLLHSGVLPRDRNLAALLQAIWRWTSSEPEVREKVRLTLVGNLLPEHAALIQALRLQDVVEIRAYLPVRDYQEALRSADVLLAIAYDRAPHLIPGKLYEYWAAQRPILLLAEEGAAKDLLLKYNLGFVVSPDNPVRIEEMLRNLYRLYCQQTLPEPDAVPLANFDRKHLTRQLAQLMEELVTP